MSENLLYGKICLKNSPLKLLKAPSCTVVGQIRSISSLFLCFCKSLVILLIVYHLFCYIGTEGPGISLSEERQSASESSSVSVIYNPYASLSIEQQRQKLPVFKVLKILWIKLCILLPSTYWYLSFFTT